MRTCIAAIGARTPLGRRAWPSAAAVRAGISRVAAHPYMVDKAGDPYMVAVDSTLAAVDRIERMFALATSALDEALEGVPLSPGTKLPIWLALPEIGRHFTADSASTLARRISAHVAGRCEPQLVVMTEGNAGGVWGIERAIATIESGVAPCCIVGGVDSFLDADLLEDLDAEGRIASLTNRWGFPPGEGAGMLVVCSAAFAHQTRLPRLAWIAAAVSSNEPNRMNTESICTGQGLARSMEQAAAHAGTCVTKQYCDINGERYRENELAYAILRAPAPAFENAVDYVAPADCWGHQGAASVPLLTLLPIVHHARGASPGAWPMVWCSSENGRRGALVLHLEEASGPW